MAKQKKLEKAAKKAFERAEAAVADARRAAEKLDKKKAKKRARALEKELAALTGGVQDASAGTTSRDDGVTDAASLDLTPPLPSVRDETVEATVEFAGSVTTTVAHDPELDQLTVQALRDAARARGLLNVSRLTKGQLIERLSE
ncbi:Rho termination factor N-terminal domain-containing protein [Leifsonia sp. NPDC014704]|uniref:Rho termination factor N-terminal domain-containing protein n=1 Tax=Leifsonia sp. NPDC014704 TaxID=3364123 RepID=UPI0036F48B55